MEKTGSRDISQVESSGNHIEKGEARVFSLRGRTGKKSQWRVSRAMFFDQVADYLITR